MSEIRWVSETKCDGATLLISAYCVMHSGAGYYIGRYSKDLDGECKGMIGPWDRNSGYYRTKENAEQALKEGYESDDNTSAEVSKDYLYNNIN